METKVVVTGLGAIASNGNSLNDFWESTLNGKDGYTNNECYLKDFPFKLVGVIKGLKMEDYLISEEIESYDKSVQYALIGAQMAIQDSNLKLDTVDKKRVAVVLGSTCGTNYAVERDNFVNNWYLNKAEVSKHNYDQYRHYDIPNAVSRKFGFQGVSYLEGTACASGNHSIGEASDLIRLGLADVVICGGAEALSLLPLLGFNAMMALASKKCAPYDKNRDGVVIGEGAGILVLESEKHAKDRNASIYASVSGWSVNCDAGNITAPIEDGTRAGQLIELCLSDASLMPDEIGYISLHGTGTQKNDIAESNGIKKAFKDKWKVPYSSSIKSMIGHTFGAAGALNSIAAIMAISKGYIPPSINIDCADDSLDLNMVTELNKKTEHEIIHALSLSFGFGGCNTACLFSKYI